MEARHSQFGIRQGLAGLALLVLAACGGGNSPAYQNAAYTLPATPTGRMCVAQCGKSRDYCRESCALDHRACMNEVQTKAQRDYDAYARERFAKHKSLDLFPSDFENPEACNAAKKGCENACDRPYNGCYRDCGGTVNVVSSCQYFCFE